MGWPSRRRTPTTTRARCSRAEKCSYTFAVGGQTTLEPLGGLQYSRLSIDGFTEAGAGVLNLVAPDRHASSTRSTLGGRAVKAFGRASAEATWLEVRAAWATSSRR